MNFFCRKYEYFFIGGLVISAALLFYGGYWAALSAGVTTLGAPVIFGNKTTSLFDIWSIQHFFVGVIIGAWFTGSKIIKPSKRWVATILAVAYYWELQELSGELGMGMFDLPLPQKVGMWFGGVEHWSNRFIADPLLALSGSCCGRIIIIQKRNLLLYGVHAFSLIFLILHLFVPNSMGAQDLLSSF